MVNYSNGKIYRFVNMQNNEFYVGSTCQPLCERKVSHKVMARTANSKLYTTMRSVGIDKFEIYLIENYSCSSKEELRAREQYFIEELQPTLNVFSAILNLKNRKQNRKAYHEKNRDTILERKRNYYKANIEARTLANTRWVQENRDKSNAIKYRWCQKQITCTKCNIELSQGCLSRHRKTKAHQRNLLKTIKQWLNEHTQKK